MAKSTKLGDLLIGIQLQTKALEQGLNEVKKQLNKHGSDVRKTGTDYEKLAIVAGIAFYKIASSITKGLEAYNQFNNASIGLKSVVQGTGQDFQQAQKFIEQYISDGLVPASNAMTAYKNLASRGYGHDQIVDTMNRLKDSAAFGRQASLTLGEAVQSATEGLKNENSILVDNAGVTKNVSVMWKEYAETIGKSVDQLTKAEKIQAEYAGIMNETRFQIGDAAKYSREFAGAQAQNAAAALKLKQVYGESLAPIFREIYAIITPLTQSLAEFVDENQSLVGVSTMVTAGALLIITTYTSMRAAIKLLLPAMLELKVALTGLAAHPAVLALAALAAVIGVIVVKNNQAKRATEEYNTALAEHNRLVKEGASAAQVTSEQEKIDKLKELQGQYEEAKEKYNEYLAASEKLPATSKQDVIKYNSENKAALRAYTEDMKKLKEEMRSYGATEETITRIIAEKEAALKKAQQASLEDLNAVAREIAQKKVAQTTTENLIKTYKSASKGSSEWYEAQQKLAEQFPQFSTASGILIDAIEGVTKAENSNVAKEWSNLQEKVKIAAKEVNLELEKKKAKLATLEASRNAMVEEEQMSRAFLGRLSRITQEIAAQKALVDGDMSALDALNAMAKSTANDITGIKPIDYSKFTSSYENKAMNSALKVMEHKKRMDQLTLEDEIATLNTILQKYARTADEKMDIEERLYDAKKALLDRDKKNNEEYLDSLEQAIQDRTDASFSWIDNKKSYDELSGTDEIAAYERMKKYHTEYLDSVLRDTKITKEQKDKVYASEMATIKDIERRIFEVRKSYAEQAVNEYIRQKQKQYDWEEEQENEALNDKLRALEKEYSAQEREMNADKREAELDSLREEEKKFQNAATKEGKERLKSIREQIADLEEEAEKDRLDEEKEARKEEIEQEIKDNKEKYKNLREELETSQKEMLAAATEYAKESNTELTKASDSISTSLTDIIRQFDDETNRLVKTGLEKLRGMISEYKQLMSEFTVPSIGADPLSSSQINSKNGQKQGVTVNVNDYGDKIINSKDEAVDYTEELFTSAKNTARVWGAILS